MTHRQSVNGSSRLIASVPAPTPAAQPQRPAGTNMVAGDISLIDPGDGPWSVLSARDSNVRAKEVHGKK